MLTVRHKITWRSSEGVVCSMSFRSNRELCEFIVNQIDEYGPFKFECESAPAKAENAKPCRIMFGLLKTEKPFLLYAIQTESDDYYDIYSDSACTDYGATVHKDCINFLIDEK